MAKPPAASSQRQSTDPLTRRRSFVPYVWFVTLVFSSLPWLIKFVILQIDNPKGESAFIESYPEFAFIPLTLALYVVGLAAENYERIKGRSDILSVTTLASMGGIVSLTSFFIFAEKMPKILQRSGELNGMINAFVVVGVGTIFFTWFASTMIHKARNVGEERDV